MRRMVSVIGALVLPLSSALFVPAAASAAPTAEKCIPFHLTHSVTPSLENAYTSFLRFEGTAGSSVCIDGKTLVITNRGKFECWVQLKAPQPPGWKMELTSCDLDKDQNTYNNGNVGVQFYKVVYRVTHPEYSGWECTATIGYTSDRTTTGETLECKSLGLLRSTPPPPPSKPTPPFGAIGGEPPTPEPVKPTINVVTITNSTAVMHVKGGRGGQIYIRNRNDAGDHECSWTKQLIRDSATISVNGLTPGSPYEFQLFGEDASEVHTVATTTGEPPKQTKYQKQTHDKLVLFGLKLAEPFLFVASLPTEYVGLIISLAVETVKFIVGKATADEDLAKWATEIVRATKNSIPTKKFKDELAEALKKGQPSEAQKVVAQKVVAGELLSGISEALLAPLVDEIIDAQTRKVDEDLKPCQFEPPLYTSR